MAGFPVLGAIAGVATGISAAKKLFGGSGRKASAATNRLAALRPRIRNAGAEATGIGREAVARFRDFDAMEGFDEELAARTRAPLEAVRATSQAGGRFRSGRAVQSEQETIGREAAQLLTARQRLQLGAAGGLASAGAQLGSTSLDFLGAESDLEAGMAEFFEGKSQQESAGLFDAFKLFLETQRGG
ncbi:MAG: hypothetical protein GY906_26510 [bacterium]|nr:hypothetical protein [bacterium]